MTDWNREASDPLSLFVIVSLILALALVIP